jgi:hypothetical protein
MLTGRAELDLAREREEFDQVGDGLELVRFHLLTKKVFILLSFDHNRLLYSSSINRFTSDEPCYSCSTS